MGRAAGSESLAGDPQRRLALVLLLSVIPAALVGFLLEDWFDSFFRDAVVVIPVVLVVGAVLARQLFGTRARDLDHLDYGDAALIGAAQALALLPGSAGPASRSLPASSAA